MKFSIKIFTHIIPVDYYKNNEKPTVIHVEIFFKFLFNKLPIIKKSDIYLDFIKIELKTTGLFCNGNF